MSLEVSDCFDPNPTLMGDSGALKFVIAVDTQKCCAFTCKAQHKPTVLSLETEIAVGHSTTDWHNLEQRTREWFKVCDEFGWESRIVHGCWF
jgi:hypothetical protein